MKNYFFCYDKRLRDFLRYEKNIDYITEGRHLKTGMIFTLFERTEFLNQALQEWKNR
ncbi:hypothetical protein PNH38_02505 [Anoxybacillus rupiensis]|uniref:DUF5659 domain-containing protein n=1 Tax=Anoxybacteroides rupiense TaxID=311460 RepID=A0ABT5W0M1_9BACL|nr:hypothetical protein [Anoxybacillus rupiensis]MDE8562752.1 hypothetical protein [Anoxybacillus rupiensis]